MGDAKQFNQDIGKWQVAKALKMSSMFRNAESFDHDLRQWSVAKVTDQDDILKVRARSTTNSRARVNTTVQSRPVRPKARWTTTRMGTCFPKSSVERDLYYLRYHTLSI